jgi:hypothetical protein
MMSTIKSRTEAPALAPLTPILSALERATDIALQALFPLIADAFAKHEDVLRRGTEGQNEVLSEIAALIGLDPDILQQPLESPEREARVQREAWHTAATWTGLTLLWTLTQTGDMRLSPDKWVAIAAGHDLRPPGESGLAEDEERPALQIAAEALIASDPLKEGLAMLLLSGPLFVRSDGSTVEAAHVHPSIIVHQRGLGGTDLPALQAGDEVWFDGTSARPPVNAGYREKRSGVVTVTHAGELVVEEGLQLARVAERVWCYCSGIPAKTRSGRSGRKAAIPDAYRKAVLSTANVEVASSSRSR